MKVRAQLSAHKYCCGAMQHVSSRVRLRATHWCAACEAGFLAVPTAECNRMSWREFDSRPGCDAGERLPGDMVVYGGARNIPLTVAKCQHAYVTETPFTYFPASVRPSEKRSTATGGERCDGRLEHSIVNGVARPGGNAVRLVLLYPGRSDPHRS
jgi:hypothetical protein